MYRRTLNSSTIRRQSLYAISIISIALCVTVLLPATVWASGNDILNAQWQTDYAYDSYNINYSTPYYSYIQATTYADTTAGTNTSGWISVTLHPPEYYQDGSEIPGSEKFSQVGVMQAPNGQDGTSVYWFVESEAELQCLSGTAFPIDSVISGCAGDSGAYVRFGQWNPFSIYHANGRWFAGLVDWTGQYSIDVAAMTLRNDQGIYYDSGTVYGTDVAAEEIYGGASDPQIGMGYYFYHPSYYRIGTGYQDWPGGQSNPSAYDPFYLSTPGRQPPPYCLYGGYFGFSDPRLWYVGGGGTCNYVFP